MFDCRTITFILLSLWLLVQLSTSKEVHSSGWVNDKRFEAKQQIFNIEGACNSCNTCKKICMVPNGYKITSRYGSFKIHPELMSWNDARKTCVAEGAHLGVFQSIDEINLIIQALPGNNVPRVWVGYHDQFVEGDWTTVWDKPLGGDDGIVTSWWPNQPDDYKGLQDCAVLDKNGMDDDVCDRKFPFVCKYTSKDCNNGQ